MSRGHVWRTTPPAFGSFRSGNRNRYIWLALLALPVAVISPVIWVFSRPPPAPPVQHIGTVVKVKAYYRFDLLTPPSRLRRPGSIYHVDGSSVRKVCEATPEVLDGKVDVSDTISQTRQSEENSQFFLSGSFVHALNGRLVGARVVTIEYGMKDVVISEIALATLRTIERVLMSEKDCDDEVNALLSANRKVCSGYSSLTASIVYKVRFDRSSNVVAQAELTVVIKKAIEDTGSGKISVRNAEEFVGENLIYGILLSSRCLVIDTSPGRASGAGTPSLPAPSPKT